MSLVHGTGVDGASATGVNPVLIGGKDAAGNIDTLKVESGVASATLAAGTAIIGKVAIDQTTPGTTNAVTLSGSKPEQASAQDTQVATTAVTYTKAVGATQMEVYCETGYVRVRTDGQPCTGTTGEPIAAGFGSGWVVDSISVYYIQESVITVVSR
jgi:hypothetical protein